MTSAESSRPAAQAPGDHEFPAHLGSLLGRLHELRSGDSEMAHVPELVLGLETAYEELRVADEEVRTQQLEITRLLEGRNLLHWQHERLLSMLPVPAIVTDAQGIIRSVNAAAAVITSMRVARMLGRPVFGIFDGSDRRELRQFLSGSGARTLRRLATVVPREGPAVQVVVTAAVREPGAEVSWILVSTSPTRERNSLTEVPEALSRLAGLPALELTVQETLQEAAATCRRTLGEEHELSVALGQPSDPEAVASTSQLAQLVDGAQIAAAEGPCVDAFAQRGPVTSPDVRRDPRWPRLAPMLPEQRFAAVAVPIEVGERLVGCLNVYAPGSGLRPDVPEAAELLAATLGAVVYELELNDELRRLGDDLKRALGSRAVIEQAKGIIMGERHCTAEEAFEHLARVSSVEERKLRDVAREIVERVGARSER